jgi:tol-pal system protein YbgF
MTHATLARAAAAALVLLCSAPMVSAQLSLPPSVSLRAGDFLGTNELATVIRNLVRDMNAEISKLRAEQADGDRQLQSQLTGLRDENRRLQDELVRVNQELQTKLTSDNQELRVELARQKQELQGSLAAQEAQFRRVVGKLDTDLDQLRRSVAELSGDQSVLASDIRVGKDGLSKFQIDSEQLNGRLNALQSQLGNLRETTTRMESASAGLGKKDQELNASLVALTSAQGSLRDELGKRLDNMDGELTKAASERAKAASDLAKSASDLADMRKAVAELRATVAVLEAGLKGAERSANDVKEVSSKIDELKRRIEPVETTIDGRVFEALPAEVAAYKAAVAKVQRADYAAARVDLQQFLASVPNTGFRGSALYWLGQAQYASSQCREAQASFGEMVKFAPDHPLASDAMLAIANCQLELKEPRANVRRSLDNLIKLHPKSKAAAEAKDLLARLPR